jgi:hypothetical protein
MNTDDKDELAALKKKVEELEAKVSPPKSTFVPMTDEEHRDWVHQMNERRMAQATPPSVRQYFANQDDRLLKEVTLRDGRAPTGPSSQGVIPSSQQVSNVRETGGTGWVAPTPLRPPDGVAQADRLMDAADARDRIELAQRIASHEAAMRAAGKK